MHLINSGLVYPKVSVLRFGLLVLFGSLTLEANAEFSFGVGGGFGSNTDGSANSSSNARANGPPAVPYYAREERVVEQIEPDIFDGDAVTLSTEKRDFLGIYLEADEPKGSVLVLHGRDVHPEDANVAAPLRIGLAEAGWTTLAIQLPLLQKGSTYYDYVPILGYAHPRIEAAIKFLRDQGQETVIVAAHSCGAHMANSWLNQNGDSAIEGYVAMGLGTTDYRQNLQTPFPLAKMSVPVLDIYGEKEFPRPLAMRADRLAMLKQGGNAGSKQMSVVGADHWFHGEGEVLTEKVAEWLNATDFSRP
ncbi:MAG: DUF3530 family protein [Methylococcales bacterium]|nr:DUF3530 family protein [Methylococcales bacterium]